MLSHLGAYSGFACQECGTIAQEAEAQEFDAYFRGEMWECQSCQAQQSLFKIISRSLKSEHPLTPGALSLGAARTAYGTVTLRQGATQTLELSELGVPEGATILGVYLSPEGENPVFPAVVQQQWTTAPVPAVLHFFGHVLGEPDHEEGQLESVSSVMCIWLTANVEPEMRPLMSSIEAFSLARFQDAVVPASVAVEDKLGSVLRAHYEQFAGKDKVNSFLTDGATFGYQLSPVLPSLMAAVGAPAMTQEVSSRLSALRTLRNKVAHEHREVTRDEAAEVLLGAVFGYRYLSLYGPLLSRTKSGLTLT